MSLGPISTFSDCSLVGLGPCRVSIRSKTACIVSAILFPSSTKVECIYTSGECGGCGECGPYMAGLLGKWGPHPPLPSTHFTPMNLTSCPRLHRIFPSSSTTLPLSYPTSLGHTGDTKHPLVQITEQRTNH